jgi:hypothetical protein
MRRWLPPHRVAIKQPRQIGDFLDGPFSFVVSERFKLLYEASNLVGLKEFHPLEIVQMGAYVFARYAREAWLLSICVRTHHGRPSAQRF